MKFKDKCPKTDFITYYLAIIKLILAVKFDSVFTKLFV